MHIDVQNELVSTANSLSLNLSYLWGEERIVSSGFACTIAGGNVCL